MLRKQVRIEIKKRTKKIPTRINLMGINLFSFYSSKDDELLDTKLLLFEVDFLFSISFS